MKTKTKITQQQVQDLFTLVYDKLVWKSGRRKGKRAGTEEPIGYRRIAIANERWYEHQLIHLFCFGYIPERPNVIDHIDRNGLNNYPSNLRDATRRENYDNVE